MWCEVLGQLVFFFFLIIERGKAILLMCGVNYLVNWSTY